MQFDDGSIIKFKHAFHVKRGHLVAVFTEHCGYHEYENVDVVPARLSAFLSEEDWSCTPVGRNSSSPDYVHYQAIDESMMRLMNGFSKRELSLAIDLAREFGSDAEHVQDALRELGHVVSRHVAAYVWNRYSYYMAAAWMSGAESTTRARETLWKFFGDLDGTMLD